jgi:opacity protein-like surface antigen
LLSQVTRAQDDEYAEEMGEEVDGDASTKPTSIPGPLALFAGVRLGFGGTADYDPGASEDLVTTFGLLQAGADYVVMDYFAIGGELRLARWGTDWTDDLGYGRSWLIDFVARPRGRYVLSQVPLELYGTLPLGLSIPGIHDDWSATGKAGFTFGIGAGANYPLTDTWMIGGEMIYLKHWIGLESQVVSGGVQPDLDLALGQFNLAAYVYYAL